MWPPTVILLFPARPEFHAQINDVLPENFKKVVPRVRGMPVYDSIFDAVLSGKNLFIQAPGQGRSLQYLVPLVHDILQQRAAAPPRRRRESKHKSEKNPSPESSCKLLVICPRPEDATEVKDNGTRLVKKQEPEIMVWAQETPRKAGLRIKEGCHILTSSPEILLQWLAIAPARASLLKTLEGVETLVVDGKGSTMWGVDFLETLAAVLKDIPLQRGTQRIVVSDKRDPDLHKHLERMVLSRDFDFHHDLRMDPIQTMREIVQAEKKLGRRVTWEEEKLQREGEITARRLEERRLRWLR
ncbi:ATP-dependent RNA helicase mss116, mitochondrial precursor [Diaporthe helianthi]|uniref:ATP-dependent RNA helicase mss116, mitochondrial n=1 Tax=Diaporthe helianthi TaxID=158607 RepID=A0A2P5HJ48_DIAHE|nr:ATP-dependent RNA helicase mss116, mitochondrial precursor [Diaporthe helianthi]